MKPPHYQEFIAAEILQVASLIGGVIKIIAGDYYSDQHKVSGPVTGIATQPLFFDIVLRQQQQLNTTVDVQYTALVYVYEGELYSGEPNQIFVAGQPGFAD